MSVEGDSANVHGPEQVETQERFLLSDNYFVRDRYSMVIFRLTDHEGRPPRSATASSRISRRGSPYWSQASIFDAVMLSVSGTDLGKTDWL